MTKGVITKDVITDFYDKGCYNKQCYNRRCYNKGRYNKGYHNRWCCKEHHLNGWCFWKMCPFGTHSIITKASFNGNQHRGCEISTIICLLPCSKQYVFSPPCIYANVVVVGGRVGVLGKVLSGKVSMCMDVTHMAR